MEKDIYLNNVKVFIKLVSLYLNNKEDPDFVIDQKLMHFLIALSKRNSTSVLLYRAITGSKVQYEKDSLGNLEECYLANIRKNVLFDKERQELYDFMDKNEIDYLPLKGIVINNYYPDKNVREYADNDILVPDSKTPLIKKFFTGKGYEIESYKRGNHDAYLKKPFFNFEIHRALFQETEDNAKNAKYFADYLAKSQLKGNHEHYLKSEDFYIYFLAHSYKHFHVSGCGLRTLIDIYLFLKKENLDFDYVNEELKKLDLLDFSNDMIDLSTSLFDGKELNEKQEELLLDIASSGTYGTLERGVDRGVKEKGKFKYLMRRIFPPYSFYKTAYPWAYKVPILIPIAWLARFFRVVFKSPKRAVKEIKIVAKHKNK